MRKHYASVSLLILLILISGCSLKTDVPTKQSTSHKTTNAYGGYHKTGPPYTIGGRTYYPLTTAANYRQSGTASWYGAKFHGKKTANGEIYNMQAFSAAHRTLPLPTQVRVTNKENGRSIIVRVNDRGPFVKDRLIDLSYAAAKALGVIQKGTAEVYVESLEPSSPPAPQKIAKSSSKSHSEFLPTPVYIQLGAFSTSENAERLRKSLIHSYPKVHIHEFTHDSGLMFRVRLGPYRRVAQVEQDMITLKGEGFSKAITVVK